jgi:hypothetical protein
MSAFGLKAAVQVEILNFTTECLLTAQKETIATQKETHRSGLLILVAERS